MKKYDRITLEGLLTQWQSTRLLTEKFWVQIPGIPRNKNKKSINFIFFNKVNASPHFLRNKNKSKKMHSKIKNPLKALKDQPLIATAFNATGNTSSAAKSNGKL